MLMAVDVVIVPISSAVIPFSLPMAAAMWGM